MSEKDAQVDQIKNILSNIHTTKPKSEDYSQEFTKFTNEILGILGANVEPLAFEGARAFLIKSVEGCFGDNRYKGNSDMNRWKDLVLVSLKLLDGYVFDSTHTVLMKYEVEIGGYQGTALPNRARNVAREIKENYYVKLASFWLNLEDINAFAADLGEYLSPEGTAKLPEPFAPRRGQSLVPEQAEPPSAVDSLTMESAVSENTREDIPDGRDVIVSEEVTEVPRASMRKSFNFKDEFHKLVYGPPDAIADKVSSTHIKKADWIIAATVLVLTTIIAVALLFLEFMEVESIRVLQNKIELDLGSWYEISDNIEIIPHRAADSAHLRYTSSNPDLVAVSSDGTATVRKAGESNSVGEVPGFQDGPGDPSVDLDSTHLEDPDGVYVTEMVPVYMPVTITIESGNGVSAEMVVIVKGEHLVWTRVEDSISDDTLLTFRARHPGESNTLFTTRIDTEAGQFLDWRIHYKNLADEPIDNVIAQVELPANLQYVSGSTVLYNSLHPNGTTAVDNASTNIVASGVNVGGYNPQGDCYVDFQTITIGGNLYAHRTQQSVRCTIWDREESAETAYVIIKK